MPARPSSVRPSRLALAGAAALGACLLSACGGSDAYVGDDGEDLSLGDTYEAEVSDSPDYSGRLDVTLDRVEEGDSDDLEGLEGAEDRDPYYLQFTLGNPDGESFSGATFGGADLGLVNGLAEDGTALSTEITVSDFAPCPSTELSSDFDAEGATAKVCVLVLAGDDVEVVGANYIPGELASTTIWMP